MERERPRYPIGTQDFAKLREKGEIYVDKTALIYELTKNNYIFLSRPRRFGKSLLLSTIRYYFEGRKNLFKGLEIMKYEKDWIKHPVFLLSLARYDKDNENSLEDILDRQLRIWEEEYGVEKKGEDYSNRLADIITKACLITGNKCVLLIDEYDSALISTLQKKELHKKNRAILKPIFTLLKDLDEYLQFGMLTGITRFGKMSIFSGLNNLNDISLEDRYSNICGITTHELESYFQIGMEDLSKTNGWSKEETFIELKRHYDGYHFSAHCVDLYNPFSLLNAFSKQQIDNFWFATGTPTFLVEKLKNENINLDQFLNQKVQQASLTEADSSYISTVAILFQSGYLTIKNYDPLRRRYQLGIPNKEVEEGLSRLFLRDFLYPDLETGNSWIFKMLDALETGRPQDFIENIKSFFAGVPFDMSKGNREVYFHNAFYILCNLLGVFINAERHTSAGSIDILISNRDYIYVIELKMDRSAEEALKQIEEKDYALPWHSDGRKIFKIGINFSTETRNISEWLVK